MQYASLRKKIYSIPMEATNLALIYNKDLLRKAGYDAERPPQTWDELKTYALKLSEDYNHDGNYDQIGFFVPVYPASGPLSSWMMWQWIPYLWQAGGYIVNEDQTEVLYNSNAGVQALTLWKEIYNSLNLSSFTVDYDVAFASQRVAMSMDGPWNLPRFNNIMKNIDWAFAPLPEGPEKRATVVGGEYLVIFKQSSYPEEAWTFIKWIIRPDVQARWAMKSGYLPVRQSVRQVPEFAEYLEKHPNFKVFVDQMDVAQAQRPLDNFGLQITRHIAEAIEAATLGGMDPQETLNRSAEKSNKLLKSVQKEQ
jgi:multiple sugar transport system substrate-binding protein